MLQGVVINWLGALFGGRTESAEDAAEGHGGDDEPDPWTVVLSAFDEVQATIAIARLQDEGIPARMRREGVRSALPVNVGIIGRMEVLVPESMIEKALDVLDADLPSGGGEESPA